jgi:hypothetical protein
VNLNTMSKKDLREYKRRIDTVLEADRMIRERGGRVSPSVGAEIVAEARRKVAAGLQKVVLTPREQEKLADAHADAIKTSRITVREEFIYHPAAQHSYVRDQAVEFTARQLKLGSIISGTGCEPRPRW